MVRCEAFFLFVKYAVIDGDVSLNLNVFLFLPVVLVLMSVTYFFLYHSVMVPLNSAIRDYRVNHKRDAEVDNGLSSSERAENVTLTEGEKEDRKRNLDVCYLSSLFASAFLSISGYRPFLNSYTIVLFVLSVVLLAIYLFSMIRLLILEKREGTFRKTARFFPFSFVDADRRVFCSFPGFRIYHTDWLCHGSFPSDDSGESCSFRSE